MKYVIARQLLCSALDRHLLSTYYARVITLSQFLLGRQREQVVHGIDSSS